jgi:hypothetical protein
LAWTHTIRSCDWVTEVQEGVYLVLLPEFQESHQFKYLERIKSSIEKKSFLIENQSVFFEVQGKLSCFDSNSWNGSNKNSIAIIEDQVRNLLSESVPLAVDSRGVKIAS